MSYCRKRDWHGFVLPAPELPIARGQKLHIEAGQRGLLGVAAFAQVARAAESLEVCHRGRPALAPRHDVVAMHKVERNGPTAVVTDAGLALPNPPDFVTAEYSPGIKSHVGDLPRPRMPRSQHQMSSQASVSHKPAS